MTITDPEPFLDIGALATHLSVTESFIRRLIHERRIPFHKIGKFIRFAPSDIKEWLEEQRVARSGATPNSQPDPTLS